ncbi:MAG: thioredoxin family protein [Bacteroidota bacterium]|nr:thioredoxin family protein [Bacteroidota bacterium]
MKRKIEIFTAGCPVCEEQVEKIKEAACPSCDVVTLNVSSDKNALSKAKEYNVKSLPAVAIDGKLAECCSSGIDLNVLKKMGLGVAG